MSTYNVQISNSFNHEQQLKDTESATKNKLIDLLSELKLVLGLGLDFKKIESDKEKTCRTFQK